MNTSLFAQLDQTEISNDNNLVPWPSPLLKWRAGVEASEQGCQYSENRGVFCHVTHLSSSEAISIDLQPYSFSCNLEALFQAY